MPSELHFEKLPFFSRGNCQGLIISACLNFVFCVTLDILDIARYIAARNYAFGRNTCKEISKNY